MNFLGRPQQMPTEREEEHRKLNDEGKTIHRQHMLLRKSPWVERAESNSLPAKELKS